MLLVEAGGSHKDHFTSQIPLLPASLVSTAADWNLTTVPQPGLNDRVIEYTRGHGLGGSSLINYMGYNRGSNDTYDRWAAMTGDQGWSSERLDPYFRKSCRLVPPADGRDYSNEALVSAHGHGPVQVSVGGYPSPLDHRVIKASKDLGGRYAFSQDINTGNGVGIAWGQFTVGDGKRDSAATAYLDPLLEACQKIDNSNCRSNLDILINTHATKLLQTGESSGFPRFGKILVKRSADDTPIKVIARKEIVLSAGVLGSPKLLMQSGIGPSKSLVSLNIPVIVDLPSMGQNLTDHVVNALYWTIKEKTTVDPILQDHDIAGEGMKQWIETHRGPFASTVVNTLAFMRLPEDAPILEDMQNPAAGPKSGNTEILFAEGFLPITNIPLPASGNYITLIPSVVSPTSRGSLSLNSADPFDPPIIDPKYMSTEFDQYSMVQAMKDAINFVKNKHFNGYIDAAYGPLAGLNTDAELLEYAKAHSDIFYHGTGTAKMSPAGADWGVVDPDLTVKGTRGLRVVDASVFVSKTRLPILVRK